MSQLQESIYDMLPTDPMQAIPASDLRPMGTEKQVRTCLQQLRKAQVIDRMPKVCPGKGKVFVYWRKI